MLGRTLLDFICLFTISMDRGSRVNGVLSMASSRQTTTLQNSFLEVVFIASLSCSLHCATDSSKVMETLLPSLYQFQFMAAAGGDRICACSNEIIYLPYRIKGSLVSYDKNEYGCLRIFLMVLSATENVVTQFVWKPSRFNRLSHS